MYPPDPWRITQAAFSMAFCGFSPAEQGSSIACAISCTIVGTERLPLHSASEMKWERSTVIDAMYRSSRAF
jgi:hypothetical protein